MTTRSRRTTARYGSLYDANGEENTFVIGANDSGMLIVPSNLVVSIFCGMISLVVVVMFFFSVDHFLQLS